MKRYLEFFEKKIEGLSQLKDIYLELDRHIAEYKSCFGFDCLKDCANCCNTSNQNIEVSEFEFFHLAIHLWENDLAYEYLQRLEELSEDSPCLLFCGDFSLTYKSGCSAYLLRPLLCRLFGFSARYHKSGMQNPILCKIIKRSYPELEARILSNSDFELPMNVYYDNLVAALNPNYSSQKYPINLALEKAIKTIGLIISFSSLDFDPENSPTTPNCPNNDGSPSFVA
ncbi:MAG: YkgJ family cysteine cluster protein [Spirochaetales bacterium]|nr:YkgJ family cysteine cluster protein [Spirochaetales bacterium]